MFSVEYVKNILRRKREPVSVAVDTDAIPVRALYLQWLPASEDEGTIKDALRPFFDLRNAILSMRRLQGANVLGRTVSATEYSVFVEYFDSKTRLEVFNALRNTMFGDFRVSTELAWDAASVELEQRWTLGTIEAPPAFADNPDFPHSRFKTEKPLNFAFSLSLSLFATVSIASARLEVPQLQLESRPELDPLPPPGH
ncbi:hypothetical protein H9P43_003078 [Blastocladiella emersonii ATCC 22665]|nr:hypothetical protein H9P43_003078 [Blastocladiella emersonii ATCC 22665]